MAHLYISARDEAEKSIAAILEQLERSTGSVVESISVEDVDATRLQDDRQRIKRRVVVVMKYTPGTDWVK